MNPELPKDDSETLPPELLPKIAGALFSSGAKTSLLHLLCVNRRTYNLCLPVLLHTVDLTRAARIDGQKMVRSSTRSA